MQNKKHTKRALLGSVIALILCCAMLLGTTFAWFTDSASTGKNTIQSGSLDLTLEYSTDGKTWTEVDDTTDIFSADKWEPGFTKVGAFRVSNVGNLALKYNLKMGIYKETGSTNMFGEEFLLSDYLVVKGLVQDGGPIGDILTQLAVSSREKAQGNGIALETFGFDKNIANDQMLLPGANHVIPVTIYMPTTVGNEANFDLAGGFTAPTIEFFVSVEATQYTHEEDSFGIDYDKDAEYAEADVHVESMAELEDAIKNAEDGAVIDAHGAELGQLNGATFNKDVTIRNASFTGSNGTRWCYANGDVVFENCVIKGNVYGTHFDGGNGSVTYKNCELYGWNSFGGSLQSVTFESCSFYKSSYGCIRFYQNAFINNCTFSSDYAWIDAANDGITVTFNNSEFPESKLFNNGSTANVTWILNGTDVSANVGTH